MPKSRARAVWGMLSVAIWAIALQTYLGDKYDNILKGAYVGTCYLTAAYFQSYTTGFVWALVGITIWHLVLIFTPRLTPIAFFLLSPSGSLVITAICVKLFAQGSCA